MTRQRFQHVQPVLAYAARNLDADVSLTALARRAGYSPFHLERVFAEVAGETPKQWTLRLRLERAAAMLLSSQDSVLDIAIECGFESHEVFTRAFRRHFQAAPNLYRRRASGFSAGDWQAHAALVAKIGPCIGLFHRNNETRTTQPMTYLIEKKNLEPQPVLVVRRRVERSSVATAIGEALPHIFLYAQKNAIPISGYPVTRYLEIGPGMITLEPAMRIQPGAPETFAPDGDVRADTLPGGPVAMTTHLGPYDQLKDAYAALEVWIAQQGLHPAGAPWEVYMNDPADFPDSKDWKTEVFWPVK
jgi:AraC-like DNA-binding protein/effector-binding domain-containing protein